MSPLADEEARRYSRQIRLGVVGATGQERLKAARVLIAGCGALGSAAAERLVRAGVGRVTLLDRDIVEVSNLPRQTLYTEADVAQALPKAVAAERHLGAINGACRTTPLVGQLGAHNVESLLADCDLALDGTDNFETRYLLNDAAVKLGKPWVYAGVLGTESSSFAILPGETPCLRCLFEEPPTQAPTCESVGVLGTTVGLIANWQATLALQILLGAFDPHAAKLVSLDAWTGSLRTIDLSLARREDCPCCGAREWPFLNPARALAATLLCGSDTVQVTPPPGPPLDFDAVLARLPQEALVSRNDYLLRLKLEGASFTLFRDGRALVHDVREEGRALALYDRLLGR